MTEQIRFLENNRIILKSEEGIFHEKASANSLPLMLDREDGETLFAEGKEIFVYRMDDYQWIAHFSEEDALNFYQKESGVPMDELQENFESWGEVPLTDTMYWDASDINENEAEMEGVMYVGQTNFGESYQVTFDWVIRNRSRLCPGFIACTEG